MPLYNKKNNDEFKNSRRNPCRFITKRVIRDEFISYENYGFVEERDMKNQMYYISTGTGGDKMWRPIDEVTLVKGHWVNKKRIVK